VYPVSVKGVVVRAGRVLLLRNDRDEWELPGGRLEAGETPQRCVVREVAEETGWRVTVGPLLDCWVYEVLPGKDVVIVSYGCHLVAAVSAGAVGAGAAPDPDEVPTEPVLSGEHRQVGLFGAAELARLALPDGYRRSIALWYDLLAGGADRRGPGGSRGDRL
jgi:8-oxo-dGTP pyrophosphatase MutT (NUDIX family)